MLALEEPRLNAPGAVSMPSHVVWRLKDVLAAASRQHSTSFSFDTLLSSTRFRAQVDHSISLRAACSCSACCMHKF